MLFPSILRKNSSLSPEPHTAVNIIYLLTVVVVVTTTGVMRLAKRERAYVN